jgi:hypothetical protein
VGEQHLVDEAVVEQRILGIQLDLREDLQGALTDPVQVGANLVCPQDRQLATDLSRLLDRVVEIPQIAAQRLTAADPLDEPELLEVGDVPEIPDQRAENRVVDAIELLVGERLDQLEGVAACLLQSPGQLGLAVGSGTKTTLLRCGNLRDWSRVPWPPAQPDAVTFGIGEAKTTHWADPGGGPGRLCAFGPAPSERRWIGRRIGQEMQEAKRSPEGEVQAAPSGGPLGFAARP